MVFVISFFITREEKMSTRKKTYAAGRCQGYIIFIVTFYVLGVSDQPNCGCTETDDQGPWPD